MVFSSPQDRDPGNPRAFLPYEPEEENVPPWLEATQADGLFILELQVESPSGIGGSDQTDNYEKKTESNMHYCSLWVT